MGRRLKALIQERLKPLVNFNGTPHQLGTSFGIGVFLGVIPGTGLIAAAGAAALFKLNLPITMVGACLTNPVTMPLIYGAGALIGNHLMGEHASVRELGKFLFHTVLGTTILAVFLGVAGYLLATGFALLYRILRKPS
jgi:uncharacterized protein (DUF2062 family)